MPRLKQKLLKALENAGRVAILGIGSELRGDDAVGLLVLDHLRKRIAKRKKAGQEPPAPPDNKQWRREDARALPVNKSFRPSVPVLKLFYGGTAPENLTGEIRRFKPSHLVLIDAVDLGKKLGTIVVLNPRDAGNVSFFTHKLPIKLMLDYLAAEMKFIPLLIGIQPRDLDFGVPVSKALIRTGRELADLLFSALRASSIKK